MVFLIVGGTVLGFGAYTWLLRVATPAAVGTYGFVNPVVALALAWAVGDGTLSVRTGVAAGLVVAAVIFTRERGRAPGREGSGGGVPSWRARRWSAPFRPRPAAAALWSAPSLPNVKQRQSLQ